MQTVVIPWRSPEDRLRTEAYWKVLHHLGHEELAPLAVRGELPWSPGRARNRGAALSSGPVLVFNDADTIVLGDQIREAIRLAGEAPGLVYAYRLYVRANEHGTVSRELFDPPSMGCVAIQRACFDELGGFHEWDGWGYEDCDFARRAANLWPIRRVEGVATHLWHGDRRVDDSPVDSDPEQVKANLERWQTASTA